MVVIIVINIILSISVLVGTLNLTFGLISIAVMGLFIYLVVVVRSYGLTVSFVDPFSLPTIPHRTAFFLHNYFFTEKIRQKIYDLFNLCIYFCFF